MAPNTVASACGISSSGTVTGWRNGAQPRPKAVAALIQYFRSNGLDIDVADLFAETEDDSEEIEIREMLRTSPEARMLFRAAKGAPPSALLSAAAQITKLREESQNR